MPPQPNSTQLTLPAERLRHLLTSNDVPSEHEEEILRARASVLEELLSYPQFQDKHDWMKVQLQQCRMITSAVRKLPLEVLEMIAVKALPEGTLDEPGRESLIGFGRVCKNWRYATLNTRKLWSSVRIEGWDWEMANLDVAKVVQWLGRASPEATFQPITLEISLKNNSVHVNMERVVALIVAVAPSLRHLSLVIPDQEFLPLLKHAFSAFYFTRGVALPDVFPCDKLTIDLSPNGRISTTNNFDDVYIVQDSPFQTRDLNIHLPLRSTISHNQVTERIIHPSILGCLTHLGLRTNWPLESLIETLAACQTLESLSLDFKSDTSERYFMPSTALREIQWRVRLLNLKSLQLMHISSISLRVLQILNAPSLSHLELGFTCSLNPGSRNLDILHGFLDSVRETLQILEIHYLDLPSTLDTILPPSGLPLLQELVIEHVAVVDFDLQQTIQKAPLLRALQLLDLDAPHLELPNQLAMFHGLEVLSNGMVFRSLTTAVRNLSIVFSNSQRLRGQLDPETKARVQEEIQILRDLGMSIHVAL